VRSPVRKWLKVLVIVGLAVEMKDTEPLVALFDAKKGVPRFVERLMTIKDVNAHADHPRWGFFSRRVRKI
jgi:hypothetical protein